MGNWFGKLIPDLQFIKNSKFQSNCCNKSEISVSYTKCAHCSGSGKLFLDKYNHVGLTRESQIEIKVLEDSIS